MSLRCKICGAVWETLPADAIQVGNSKGSFRMYLINGIPHDIGSTNLGRRKKAAKVVKEK